MQLEVATCRRCRFGWAAPGGSSAASACTRSSFPSLPCSSRTASRVVVADVAAVVGDRVRNLGAQGARHVAVARRCRQRRRHKHHERGHHAQRRHHQWEFPGHPFPFQTSQSAATGPRCGSYAATAPESSRRPGERTTTRRMFDQCTRQLPRNGPQSVTPSVATADTSTKYVPAASRLAVRHDTTPVAGSGAAVIDSSTLTVPGTNPPFRALAELRRHLDHTRPETAHREHYGHVSVRHRRRAKHRISRHCKGGGNTKRGNRQNQPKRGTPHRNQPDDSNPSRELAQAGSPGGGVAR